MKKIIATLFVATIALTGCASGNANAETGEPSSLYESRIELADGRTVTCIKLAIGYKGGLSCDWDGAK